MSQEWTKDIFFTESTVNTLGYYSTFVGDNVNNQFTVVHNLCSQDVVVTVREVGSNLIAYPAIEITSLSSVTVDFNFIPGLSAYDVTVFASASAKRITGFEDRITVNVTQPVQDITVDVTTPQTNLIVSSDQDVTTVITNAEVTTTNVDVGVTDTVEDVNVAILEDVCVWGSIIGTLSAQTDLWNYLQSVSGGSGNGRDDVNTLVIQNSANWISTHTTVQTNSGSWNRNYIYTTSSINLLSNYKYGIDTTSQSLTATLPSVPQYGDEIEIFDIAGKWSLNNLYINNNGNKIEQLFDTLKCNVRYGLIKLVYTSNNIGWRIVPMPVHDVPSFIPPIVSILVDNLSGYIPFTANFSGITNLPANIGPVNSWQWDLSGDSSPDSYTQNTTCTYDVPGAYTVTVSGINDVGVGTASITVTAVNILPPDVSVLTNLTVLSSYIPLTVNLTGINNLNPIASPISSWNWDFYNDGTVDSSSRITTVTYSAPGVYTISLTGANSSGIDIETITVTAANILPPSVSIGINSLSGTVPFTVNLTGINNLNPIASPISAWYWDLSGDEAFDSSTQITTFTYTSAGTYNITLSGVNSVGTGTAFVSVTATELILPTDPYSDYVALLLHFNP